MRPTPRVAIAAAILAAEIAMVLPASADEAADAMAAAEQLVGGGQTAEGWAAFDRAVEAFWAAAPMAFRIAAIVDGADQFGLFRPRTTHDFAAGDTLTAYLAPVGYGWTPLGDEYRIRLVVDLELRARSGAVIVSAPAFATLERLLGSRSREFTATIALALPELRPDDYELVLTLKDAATAKVAVAVLPFRVVR